MKIALLVLPLISVSILAADPPAKPGKPGNPLEQAVQAGAKVKDVNPGAARPGENPHAYASPGNSGKPPSFPPHGNGPDGNGPPGQAKKKKH